MLLSNRISIITGGARGIGKGIALKFAEEGCTVVIVDIRDKEAEQTISELVTKKVNAYFIHCDVSDSKSVQEMVDNVINKYGKVDILVNDAGIGPIPKFIQEVSDDEWDRVLAVNLKGVFLCCRSVTPYMKEKKYGKIINISSTSAIAPCHPISYTASKGGVLTLTIDLAMELAPYNICVNAILPGPCRTDLVDQFIPAGENPDKFYEDAAKAVIPMGRIGTPSDIAGPALFFASDLSAYVTGDRLIVGGGVPWKCNI